MVVRKSPKKSSGVDLESIREVSHLMNRLRLLARIIFGTIGLTYSWLLLSGLPYSTIVNGSDAGVILQVVLILMYLSWVVGINMDFGVQASVYVSAPKGSVLSKTLYFTAASLLLAAMVLLAVRKNSEFFAAALAVFSLVSLWSLIAARQSVRSIIGESKAVYETQSDWFGREQLDIVEHYMTGDWVWTRQVVLLIILSLVNVICWVPAVPRNVAHWIHLWNPQYTEQAVSALIPVVTIIGFLAIAESWQWYKRLTMKLSVSALELLKYNYKITRKKEKASDLGHQDIPIFDIKAGHFTGISDILRGLRAKLLSYVWHRKNAVD
jgi:hypothetical protein